MYKFKLLLHDNKHFFRIFLWNFSFSRFIQIMHILIKKNKIKILLRNMSWKTRFLSCNRKLHISYWISNDNTDVFVKKNKSYDQHNRGHLGRDHMVVGFTTTYKINAYHHYCCEFESCSWWGVLNTTLCEKVCQWHATGLWFSMSTPVSSTNKTDRHDITEILLKVALNTINTNTLTHSTWYLVCIF